MAWSYSGDPSTSDKDAVRFMVGDTNNADQLMQDEEINFAVAREGSALKAAVVIARAIAAKFSRQADKAVGDLRIDLSQKAKAYHALAAQLEQEAGILAVPYAGGLTVDEKAAAELDSSLVQPAFKRGMMGYGA